MLIQILSDLHLEFHTDKGEEFISNLRCKQDIDAMIIAGDISISTSLISSLDRISHELSDIPVFFVLGNHDYYGGDTKTVGRKVRELVSKRDNLFWLDNTSHALKCKTGETLKIIGSTLWFRQTREAKEQTHNLNDFSLIRGFVPWVYDENNKAISFIEKEIADADIIVTHHLPSYSCVSEKWSWSPINCYFVCDLDYLLKKEERSRYWIFGHTHEPVEEEINGVKLICNPFGYIGIENTKYQDEYTIKGDGNGREC